LRTRFAGFVFSIYFVGRDRRKQLTAEVRNGKREEWS